MKTSANIKDYFLLDAGEDEKLESYNGIVLRRPDPLAIWPKLKPELWSQAQATYHRSKTGGGHWQMQTSLPSFWTLTYQDLKFKISPTNFKHTGIFPEQAANWDVISELVKSKTNCKVLNLFAYSGCASVVALKAGASEVVHVDAAKGMIAWAKENVALNKLEHKTIRYILDDCAKFMKREIRRNHHYDLIIMDPPSYGRGPNNELFKFSEQINELLQLSFALLSEKPLGIILNTYTTGFSTTVFANLMRANASLKGKIVSDELGIVIKDTDYILPCGQTTHFYYES